MKQSDGFHNNLEGLNFPGTLQILKWDCIHFESGENLRGGGLIQPCVYSLLLKTEAWLLVGGPRGPDLWEVQRHKVWSFLFTKHNTYLSSCLSSSCFSHIVEIRWKIFTADYWLVSHVTTKVAKVAPNGRGHSRSNQSFPAFRSPCSASSAAPHSGGSWL